MQTLDLANQRPADLYWLAFLLTGQRDLSVGVTIEALDLEEEGNPFFSTWVLAWSRRVVIAKALAAIRDELDRSARRTGLKTVETPVVTPRNWALSPDTDKTKLERALLAIDVFPRCAVLLSVFEGMPLQDAAVLMDAPREAVRRARALGLRELTRNLARLEGWPSSASTSYVLSSERQHA